MAGPATQKLAGWVPNIFIEPISGGGAPGPINSPYLLVNDGTGLFAGPLEEGIGFVDVSVLQTGASDVQLWFQQQAAGTDYGIAGPDINGDANLRVVISSDNSKVFFNDDGYVFRIDTATDKMSPAAFNGQCCYRNYEMALASNQAQLTASFDIYDFDLNGESYYALTK